MKTICRDNIYDKSWDEWMKDEYFSKRIEKIISQWLYDIEAVELKRLLKLDYSTLYQELVDNNELAAFKQQGESSFNIYKLLAYYRFSMLGYDYLGSWNKYVSESFSTSSKKMTNPCKYLYTKETILALGNPECMFEKIGSSYYFTLKVKDLAVVEPDTFIEFNNVLYGKVNSKYYPYFGVKVGIPPYKTSVEINPQIIMPDLITTCESLVFDFQKSAGLGLHPKISVYLDALQDNSTGDFIIENIASWRQTVQELFETSIQNMLDEYSMFLSLSPDVFDTFANKTLHLIFMFTNSESGGSSYLTKKLTIIGGERLDYSNRILRIKRESTTNIDIVRKVTCNNSTALTCKAMIFVKPETNNMYTYEEVSIADCTINPTVINVDNISRIWVETTVNGVNATAEVLFKVEQKLCTCDMSNTRTVYLQNDTLTLPSLD